PPPRRPARGRDGRPGVARRLDLGPRRRSARRDAAGGAQEARQAAQGVLMFERFTRDARQVVRSAETLAAGLGSPTTEAEHLLLALADCQPVLSDVGLDHDGVLAALTA